VVSKTLVFEIYKSTSAKKKKKPILVNTGTNTLNMANVATNTMTTKELLAPLASMEDLSVCMTPMSTPGASPRTRARWSQRSSTGSQFDPFVTSPLITDQNGQNYVVQKPIQEGQQPNIPPRKSREKSRDSLLKVSFENGINGAGGFLGNNKYVTPYKHDPTVMNADLPLPPVTFRRPNSSSPHGSNFNQRRTYPKIDEAEEFLLQRDDVLSSLQQKQKNTQLQPPASRNTPSPPPQTPLDSKECRVSNNNSQETSTRQVQFLTPRKHNHHQYCAFKERSPENKFCTHQQEHFSSFLDADRVVLLPEPKDRLNLIYLTLILHGIGTLMPWNMFITAKELKRGDWVHMLTEYFVEYKLGKGYTDVKDMPYATYFQQNVGFAAQIPNLVFNWINIFLNLGGNLTSRIVWTLLIEVLVFVVTIILAMVDSSEWPGVFFYLTIGCVILLNMASGMYQSTIYGLAAKLPFKYSGAVVLGSNLSGTIVAVISIISLAMGPNPRTAAIYYFITALFILLACFDTYFALPLNRFFRYHDHMFNKALHEKKRRSAVHVMPYGLIFKQCFPQCFNVFFTYFVTLTIFPAVLADVKMAHDDFPISQMYYTPITCFLTFNICAVLGNLIPSILRFPSPRWLVIPVLLRALFLPFFLLCNYRPFGVERLWPALMHWDYAYWTASGLFGLTGGYFSSLAMMYCPRTVEPEYASVAGMFGAASIVTGIFSGIGFSYLMPLIVSHQLFAFDAPEWWPIYTP